MTNKLTQAYCPCCGKEVDYFVKKQKQLYEDSSENIKFYFNGKVAKCSICGEELNVEEVDEYNQKSFKNTYREINEIVSNEDILEMMEKYQIGKRPLSIILGFGEITITRYLDGYIPTIKNSKIIRRYLNNLEDYYSLLLTHKNKISDVAFKKSCNATEKLLDVNKEDVVLSNVAKYVVSKTEVTQLSLQKILYYIQVFHLMFFDNSLFNSTCKNWSHGPVFGRIYYQYQSFKSDVITPSSDEVKLNVEDDVKEVIDGVIKYFGCYNGNVLRSFTHTEKPWLDTKKDEIIEKHMLLEFAKTIKKDYNIDKISDIKKYSEYKFNLYMNG